MMRRSVFTSLFILTALLMGVAVAAAQEAVPTASITPTTSAPVELPPVISDTVFARTDIILVGGLFIVVAVLVFAGALLRQAFDRAYHAMPPAMADILMPVLRDAAQRGLAKLDEVVLETPNKADDALMKIIDDAVWKILADQSGKMAGEQKTAEDAPPPKE